MNGSQERKMSDGAPGAKAFTGTKKKKLTQKKHERSIVVTPKKHLYVFGCKDQCMTKVGVSGNIKVRLADLKKNFSPKSLVWFCSEAIYDAFAWEAICHDRLRRYLSHWPGKHVDYKKECFSCSPKKAIRIVKSVIEYAKNNQAYLEADKVFVKCPPYKDPRTGEIRKTIEVWI